MLIALILKGEGEYNLEHSSKSNTLDLLFVQHTLNHARAAEAHHDEFAFHFGCAVDASKPGKRIGMSH